MYLNIKGQIPIKTKIYRGNEIMIPANVRRELNWNVGDKIQLYPTNMGIFLKKED